MKKLFSLFALILSLNTAFAQPANDECLGVIDLGTAPVCPFPDTFSNVGASQSVVFSNPVFNTPSCFTGGIIDRDVWFQFLVPADGSVVDFLVELTGVDGPNGSIVQPQIAVYRGDCQVDGLAELHCATSVQGESAITLELINMTPGFPIFLRISDWSLSAATNWGDFVLCVKALEPVFNMGNEDFTASCSGTLYDAGGPDNDYSNGENYSFTVCPQEFTQCISVSILSLSTEADYDYLTIYAGDDVNDLVFAQFDGFGGNVQLQVPGQCVTFQFLSDGTANDEGFELTWQCGPDECVIAQPSTCASPTVIASLPYSANGLTTCNAQNSVEASPCNNDDWLQGEDVIFTYESPGDECISINISGSNNGTAIGLFDDCPNVALACMAVDNGEGNAANPSINGAFLETAGTYYIVVDNPDFCTPFNIEVSQVNCPVVLPAAGYCDAALSLNGCGSLPSIITIAPGDGDPDFIESNINNGCWGGFNVPNFTFFYFQAQVNGEFAFVMQSANANEASDIDFQVWGPISDFDDLCQIGQTTMPIRSSYADDVGPTGLANFHPITNAPVIDFCENAFNGDSFVDALPVVQGKFYLVLINDYDNEIESGEISVNFSNTTAGVLAAIAADFMVSADTTICPGDSVQLLATGGGLYQWFPETGLSCQYCPNPIATNTQSTTYSVAINTLCTSDTLQVEVAVLTINAGSDMTICLNEDIQLIAGANFPNMNYQWNAPLGFLSCMDCPNPIVTGVQAGSFTLTVSVNGPNCTLSDEMLLTVLPIAAPAYEISPTQNVCIGDTVSLGGTAIPGVIYSWTSQPPGFTSNEANPSDSPIVTTTYYLEATNGLCPNPSFDSVLVVVSSIPTISVENDTIICQGQSVLLGNTVIEGDVTYQWTPALGLDDPNIANPLATPLQNTVYTLEAIRIGCMAQASIGINLFEQPNLEISNDTVLCNLTTIQLFAQASESGGDYLWSNGSTSQNPTVGLQPGSNSFSVIYTDACGEVLLDTMNIEVNGIEVDILNEQDSAYQGSEIVLMSGTDLPATTYQWSNGSTQDTAVVIPFFLPSETYSITVTDELGCTDTDSITMIVLEPKFDIPNAFSPNGDDLNNVFKVVILGENIEVESMSIWNRWGQLVFTEKNNNGGWDGKQDNKDAASDVYVYKVVLRLPNGLKHIEKGDLTLLR